jgi:sensor histidine kinase YesM
VRRWLALFAIWTMLGVFFASQTYITYAYSRRPTTWRQALTLALSEWYIWALLALVVVRLARRFPFERGAWGRAALVHIPAGIVFSYLHLGIYVLLAPVTLQRYASRELFQAFFPSKFHNGVLTYFAIVGVSHALGYYRRYRERELRASQLEARLAQAQLQVLKMQLHPHFLFNTLHAISALMHRDVDAADRMVARLSDLLRMTLAAAGVQQVPLRQELEFLEPYLEIEQTRFQDRLRIAMYVAPETLDALVPNLILQPIVENAIRHGIAGSPAAGRLEIHAARDGERLRIQVRDDGPGLASEWKEGLGLANTRARLEQLYGSSQALEFTDAAGGGLEVTMTIPFRAASV